MKKKVLITGAGGMLGKQLLTTLNDFEVIPLTREQLDITCTATVHRVFKKHQPDYVINCAAYTAVDQAENEPVNAYKINYRAVENISNKARMIGATLIHFSTDYVFDGTSNIPYQPTDAAKPINVYGRSKFLGEQSIRRSMSMYYIFRISWLYASHGKNFFRWVLDNDLEEMRVVDHQKGCPTSAVDVSNFINEVVTNDPQKYGTYHYCGGEAMSWYSFAKAILNNAGVSKKLNPTDSFPSAADRPEYSVMNCDQTKQVFNTQLYTVNESLNQMDFK